MKISDKIKLVNISQLSPYGNNAKKHTQEQIEKIKRSISKNSYIQPIVVSSNNEIIIGHGRYQALLELNGKDQEIEVVYIDYLTDTEIKALRILDNKLSLMTDFDYDIVNHEFLDLSDYFDENVISEMTGFEVEEIVHGEILAERYDCKNEKIENIEKELPEAQDLKKEIEIKETVGFYEMPLLNKNKCTCLKKSVNVYAGEKDFDFNDDYIWIFNSMSLKNIKNYSNMIVCFYTDDYRFDSLWNTPDIYAKKFMNMGIKKIFAPNFSLFTWQKIAWQIYNVFKSRYLSYYFQKCGFDVIVDINFSVEKSFDFCFDGIPKIDTVSIQCQNINDVNEIKNFYAGINKAKEKIGFSNMICYGGKDKKKLLKIYEKDINIIYIDSFSMKRFKQGGE